MIAFILAGLVFVGTLVLCALMLFAAGMSDSPGAAANVPVTSTFITGTIIAVLIAISHWLPHLSW
jgi:uncharacterized membrane protein